MDVDVIQAEFKFVVTTIFYVNIHILYICTMYIEAIRCKFSLYLKKAGLASRNIGHHGTKSNLRCIGHCSKYLEKGNHQNVWEISFEVSGFTVETFAWSFQTWK